MTAKKLSEKHAFTEHSGEVPVSEDSTVEKDDLVCSDEEERLNKSGEDDQKDWKDIRKTKHG